MDIGQVIAGVLVFIVVVGGGLWYALGPHMEESGRY